MQNVSKIRLAKLSSHKNLSLLGTFKVKNNLGMRNDEMSFINQSFVKNVFLPKKICPIRNPLKWRLK